MRTPFRIMTRFGGKWACRDVDERLFDFLAGELPAAGISRVRAHLRTCRTCRKTLAGMRAVVRALRKADAESRGPETLSATGRQQILAAVGRGPKRKVRCP